MLESSRLWPLSFVLAAASCATGAREEAPAPQIAPVAAVVAPAPSGDEARALLAQAETDVQRARAKRALWLKAWEELLDARKSAAANDFSATIRHARAASELAQLGLEQLAYPAVK